VATAGGEGGYGFPAIAWTDNAVIVTTLNASTGDLDFWRQPAGSGSWTKETIGNLR
jgi:hypothetical protein